jgi:hypothetical protein
MMRWRRLKDLEEAFRFHLRESPDDIWAIVMDPEGNRLALFQNI